MLLPPPYIPVHQIDVPVRHEWSDWNPYVPIAEPDQATEMALRSVSDRARFAYSIACAEWVTFRFHGLLNDERPLQFLEACWACQMSDEYALPPESNGEEWKGPIRGPIDLALMTVLNTRYAEEEGASHLDAAFTEAIALHVLVDSSTFRSWRDKTLPRLTALFPRDEQWPQGVAVPREALDPSARVTREAAGDLVRGFLQKLVAHRSPYLRRRSAVPPHGTEVSP